MVASEFTHQPPSGRHRQTVRLPVLSPALGDDIARALANWEQSKAYVWEKLGEVMGEYWGRGGGSLMPDSDRDYRDRWFDERFANLDQKLQFQARIIEERLNAYGSKLDQFLGEIRDRDNQRHQEAVAIQQTLSSLQASNRQIIIAIALGFVSVAVAILIGLLVPYFDGRGGIGG